jgi:membrane-anchored protein YejM (alkaline phosphatase superfamily)
MYDYLGVQNPLDDYSLGHLLHDTTSREWHFVGNDLNYAFIIEGDTILEHQGNGALDVYDSKMNDVQGYKIDARQFNAAMQRVNRFYK